ncbi:MAG: DHH family phosphoesterase [Myxococcales bacterium]|nr:DHH family phosphoesterase [Myxococcales bacterium]
MTAAITGAQRILLTGPIDLDGDAVGAIVAMARAIRRRWPDKAVRVICDEALPRRYAFLAADDVRFERPAEATPAFDLAIVLDGDPRRLGAATAAFEAAAVRAQVDHHRSSDPAWVDVAVLDVDAASTTALVLELCDAWGVLLDQALAAPLFAGLVFDTSIFRYRLTNPPALRAAARLLETGIDHAQIVEKVLLEQSELRLRLRGAMIARCELALDGRLAWSSLPASGHLDADIGGLVDDLVFVESAHVGALLSERADGRVKISLRSKGAVDVSAVARSISPEGGGHLRAAGVIVDLDLEAAAARMVAAVAAALDGAPTAG